MDVQFDVGGLDDFLQPPVAPGSPLRRNETVPFSFDPEEDPVVCSIVQRQQQVAGGAAEWAARMASANGRSDQPSGVTGAAPRPSPEALAAQRRQDREQRLSAKRKLAEMESSVELLAVKVVESAGVRDRLSAAVDDAAAAAEEAETRRKTLQTSRSARDAAQGSRRGAPAPFDASTFVAVATKRKLEVVNKQCLISLRQLMQHKWAFPFNKPVDHVALNLPTYPDIVKNPMDLGTVEARIKKGGVYTSCEEVHRDICLTFDNAKLFNPPATDVHIMAVTLEQFWAPRWEAICERTKEVEEGMNIEKEAAEKKTAEMSARQTLAAEEMKCAGLMADLDQLKRSWEDLKRNSVRMTKPMQEPELTRLKRKMMTLPRGFRGTARNMVAATEGAHMVPEVDNLDDDAWNQMCNDLTDFGSIAHRRLARYAKVRRRNAAAMRQGLCTQPEGEGLEGVAEGDDFTFGDETDTGEDDGNDGDVNQMCQPCALATAQDVNDESRGANPGESTRRLSGAVDPVEETLAAAAAAAAAAATPGGTIVKEKGGDEEDPLLALAMGGGNWGAMGARAAQPELAAMIASESGEYFLDRSVSRDSPTDVGTMGAGMDDSSVLTGPQGAHAVASRGKGDLVGDLLLSAPVE